MVGDPCGDGLEIEVVVLQGHGDHADAARAGEHIEADERTFGGEHLIIVAEECADDV